MVVWVWGLGWGVGVVCLFFTRRMEEKLERGVVIEKSDN